MDSLNAKPDDAIDVRDLLRRLNAGLFQILGLALLGLVAGALILIVSFASRPAATHTRVAFSFPGLSRGEYPDKAKFSPDDLRAPDIVRAAMEKVGMTASDVLVGTIRGAILIEGVIPDEVVRQRDRLRSLGQNPPPYIPDEYRVNLILPGSIEMAQTQRVQLLTEIISNYRERFRTTYASTPVAFGNAFDILRDADYPEYELVLADEVQRIQGYLEGQMKADQAKSFRSQTTNLSYSDLQSQTAIFARVHLNEALGMIAVNGLSKNRGTAMIKLEYHLQTLRDLEQKALKEQSVVNELLQNAQERSSGYVLGVKSQATQPRADSPIIDQGLIDSLLENDSYGLLVRRALEDGLRLKSIQAEAARLLERKERMAGFVQTAAADNAIISEADRALERLRGRYNKLTQNIRATDTEFRQMVFGDAIRVTAGFSSPRMMRPLALYSAIGSLLGAALGAALSFLNIQMAPGRRRTATSEV